jgi:hypothetical protein
MTAALGTLPFLATLWLLFVLGASVLEENGAKIVAALKGDQSRQWSGASVTLRMRRSARPARLSQTMPRLRAAA